MAIKIGNGDFAMMGQQTEGHEDVVKLFKKVSSQKKLACPEALRKGKERSGQIKPRNKSFGHWIIGLSSFRVVWQPLTEKWKHEPWCFHFSVKFSNARGLPATGTLPDTNRPPSFRVD